MAVDPIEGAARRVFGYRSLRPGQREAIQSILDGRDTLAVLATGEGKSAIYELAGHLLAAPTVVVSPLIALQRDQLDSLARRAGLVAVALNSSQPSHERREILDGLSSVGRRPDFVFLSPEQLANGEVLERVASFRPGLVAVDEAHLVSQWGPDFRPDYLRIAPAVEAVGRPTVLAVTATAAPPVRADILERLRMRDPAVLVRGFERKNLHLSAHAYFMDDAHKLEVLTDDVVEAVRGTGHGIVYAGTHHRVEQLSQTFARRGVRAASYHAGLGDDERRRVERAFHEDDVEVVVATIAFGMGVDKPDIRWVHHADVPGSLDEYYQEFGRAGRDGEPADAALYFRSADLALPRMFAGGTGPSRSALEAVAGALARVPIPGTLDELHLRAGLSRHRAEETALVLSDVGAIAVDVDGQLSVTGDLTEAVVHAAELVRGRRAVERSRVDTMSAYAENYHCRWQFLLEYFGEPASARCGHCDNDDRADEDDDRAKPFPRGARVQHGQFGEGSVIGYVGPVIVVAFDKIGYKRLDLTTVVDKSLLELVDE